jgi:hypothetical protein
MATIVQFNPSSSLRYTVSGEIDGPGDDTAHATVGLLGSIVMSVTYELLLVPFVSDHPHCVGSLRKIPSNVAATSLPDEKKAIDGSSRKRSNGTASAHCHVHLSPPSRVVTNPQVPRATT